MSRTGVPRITFADLRGAAIARSLFPPTRLELAVERLGFVQADPIRAPARAQDLILRQRVVDYRAGDIDRRYEELGLEEDRFVNYGYLPRVLVRLMHPRKPQRKWGKRDANRAALILAMVQESGTVHPREVDQRFAFGAVTNFWGGTSNATTHLLDAMHYRGLLRVVRRDAGIRTYAVATSELLLPHPKTEQERADELLAYAFHVYAPLPVTSLGRLASHLRYAAPQLAKPLRRAVTRLRDASPTALVDGTPWIWPAGEELGAAGGEDPAPRVRFLAPFDPVVWDRRRFELLWGWAYRFEAYTPVKKRKLGYYALPLLWRDRVIGWGNFAVSESRELTAEIGYVTGKPPRDAGFRRELDAELARLREFLGVTSYKPLRI